MPRRCRPGVLARRHQSVKDTKLAQKLGQLQPFIAVFPRTFWTNLTPFSRGQVTMRVGYFRVVRLAQGDIATLHYHSTLSFCTAIQHCHSTLPFYTAFDFIS